MNPLNWLKAGWDIIMNPSIEVIQATTEFGTSLVQCITTAAVKYGDALLGLLGGGGV